MSFSLILYNETRKRLLITLDYKSNIFTQIFMMILIFVGAAFLIGGGQFHPDQIASILLGYTVWYYARLVITNTSSDMLGEAQIGTLEQIYMSPMRPELILLGRMLVMLLMTTVIVILPTLLIGAPFGVYLPFSWDSLIIFALILVGLFGFALALAGAALVFKQVDTLADLIQNVLLFLTGSLVPIDHFPPWLSLFAQTLPITQGIIVIRDVTLQHQSLLDAWRNGSIPWLILNSSVYLVIGCVMYGICERYAKKRGSLGQY